MMSRSRPAMTIFVVLLLTLGSLGAGADETRTVSGIIVGESPTPDVPRCAWSRSGEHAQGAAGWVVTLTQSEGDGLHDFALTSPAASSLRVDFYDRLGSCSASARTLNHGMDHSSGSVPYGARYAVITAWSTRADVCYGGTILCGLSGPGAVVPFDFTLEPTSLTWNGS